MFDLNLIFNTGMRPISLHIKQKLQLMLFFCSFFAFSGFGQDTIRFTNGDIKVVKVSEVGVDNIKYYRTDMADGPLYMIPKSEIKKITYANGNVDTFNATPKAPAMPVYQPNPNALAYSQRLYVSRGKLIYNERPLSDPELEALLESNSNKATRDRLMEAFTEMKSYKTKQYAFGFGSAGLGLACLMVGYYSSLTKNNASAGATGAFLGVNVYLAGQIVSGIMKKNKVAKARQIANIYNGTE